MNFQTPTWHDVLGHVLANLAHLAGATTISGKAALMLVVVLLAITIGSYAAKLGTDPNSPILSEADRGPRSPHYSHL